MSFLRLSSRCVVLAAVLSCAVWGTGCKKKSDRVKSSGNNSANDGITSGKPDVGDAGMGTSGNGSVTNSGGKDETTKGANDTTNAKKNDDPPEKKAKRKVNDTAPPKNKESGSNPKKRKRGRIGDCG